MIDTERCSVNDSLCLIFGLFLYVVQFIEVEIEDSVSDDEGNDIKNETDIKDFDSLQLDEKVIVEFLLGHP